MTLKEMFEYMDASAPPNVEKLSPEEMSADDIFKLTPFRNVAQE